MTQWSSVVGVVLILMFSAVQARKQSNKGQWGKGFGQDITSCANETGVSAEEIRAAMKKYLESSSGAAGKDDTTGSTEDNKKVACFSDCVVKKRGVVDEEGKLNTEKLPAACSEEVKQCFEGKEKGDENECKVARNVMECSRSCRQRSKRSEGEGRDDDGNRGNGGGRGKGGNRGPRSEGNRGKGSTGNGSERGNGRNRGNGGERGNGSPGDEGNRGNDGKRGEGGPGDKKRGGREGTPSSDDDEP